MSWTDVLKIRYTSKELPMLKEMVEKVLDDISVGTEFYAKNYFEKFLTYRPDLKGRELGEFNRWVTKGLAERWFGMYVTKYSKRIGKTELVGSKAPPRTPQKLVRV